MPRTLAKRGEVIDATTVLIVASMAAVPIGMHYIKLRRDLRRAAKVLWDRSGRQEWWKVRLRSQYVDHDRERERQEQIVESESKFIQYFVRRYGDPEDFDYESRTTGAPEDRPEAFRR